MNTIYIDIPTFKLILEALAYVYVRTDPDAPREKDVTTEEYEAYIEEVRAITDSLFVDFCEDKNVEVVDVEDEEPDIPDDVDETNYDPYSGCDIYEADDMF